MILRGRMSGFASGALTLCALAGAPLAAAGDDALERPLKLVAPLEIPHSTNLELDQRSRKRHRRPDNIESSQLLDSSPALKPLVWPRASDMRARLVTPEVRSTPVVGWVAANLYRSRKDSGWCLEVDPGEGEYVVFYRLNLK
jgi:hypothetical protein